MSLIRKIVAIFVCFVSIFRKAICRVKRLRKNSGTLLPTKADHLVDVSTIKHSVPSTIEPELTEWNDWGASEELANSNFQHVIPETNNVYHNIQDNNKYAIQQHTDNGVINNHAMNQQSPASQDKFQFGKKVEPEPEPEPDYFSDMQPEIKKTQKILLRKKEENISSAGYSSRLGVNTVITPLDDGQLNSWSDDENAWAEETEEDLSWQADAAIKEKRQAERERRHMEQQKRKQLREQRGQHRGSTLIQAT